MSQRVAGRGRQGLTTVQCWLQLVIDHDVTMTSRCCCEHLLLLLTTTDVPAARQLVVNFFSVREFWNYCLPNLQTRVCLVEKTEVIANHACNRDSQCHVTITCSVTKTTKSYNICSAIADRSSYRPTKLGSWNPTKLWGVRLHAVESRKFGAWAVTSPSLKISMHLWLTSLHL